MGWKHQCVDTWGGHAFEHAATFASLQVECQLLVHVVGVHGVESLLKVGLVQLTAWESNETCCSVVAEEHKHVVIGGAPKLLAAGSAGEDIHEV